MVQLVAGAGTAIGGPLLSTVRPGGKYAYRQRMGMVPCAEFDVFHDDFHSFMVSTAITNGPVANTPLNGWQGAIIDTGATIVADTTVYGANGALLFDSDGATEGAAIYTTESFQIISGKRFFIECRVNTEIADDSDVQFGLSSVNVTSDPEDLWTTDSTDLVAFGLLDGSAYPAMLVDTGNGGTSAQTQTVKACSSNTWHILAIGYDGTYLRGYVDGDEVLRWSGASTTIPVSTLAAPMTLALFCGFRNGSAATTEGHIDYIRAVFER